MIETSGPCSKASPSANSKLPNLCTGNSPCSPGRRVRLTLTCSATAAWGSRVDCIAKSNAKRKATERTAILLKGARDGTPRYGRHYVADEAVNSTELRLMLSAHFLTTY